MFKIKDFINDDLTVNWKTVESIGEFQDMKRTEQNPRWHAEGSVWNHTLLVIEECQKIIKREKELNNWCRLDNYYKILLCSALMHDIGKPKTTVIGEDGNWTSPMHAHEGERIVRSLLWGEDVKDREMVCALVRNHMTIMYTDIETKEGLKKWDRISSNLDGYMIMLLLLKESDLKGSICKENKGIEKLNKLIDFMNGNK